jgi:hypothetical protein
MGFHNGRPVPTGPHSHNAFASPLNIEGYFEDNQNSILVECHANLIKILMDRAWRKVAYRQKPREIRRGGCHAVEHALRGDCGRRRAARRVG